MNRLLPLAFLLALMGGGCLSPASRNTQPASSEPTPTVEGSSLREGEFRTKKGYLDRIRNVTFAGAQGDKISSPLVITGEARLWYFEAVFPVALLDEKGKVIVHGPAFADGDWMTEDWVPFTAELTFPPQPAGSSGRVILRADNPSGLPQHDDQIEIPVTF